MTCGIYGIFSEDGKRVYIGQASNIEHRWEVHKYQLKNKHHCKFLQRHYNRHKILLFEIIEITEEHSLSLENRIWLWYKNLNYVMFNKEMSPETGVIRGENHTKDSTLLPEPIQKLRLQNFMTPTFP